jgi:hypothetical protein
MSGPTRLNQFGKTHAESSRGIPLRFGEMDCDKRVVNPFRFGSYEEMTG